jgi:hypothetical protein
MLGRAFAHKTLDRAYGILTGSRELFFFECLIFISRLCLEIGNGEVRVKKQGSRIQM